MTLPPGHRDAGLPLRALPVPSASFVGREGEIAEIGRRVAGAGLVTLTGPPGVGKTRLALEVAAEQAPTFPDGVWWVGLAALADPSLVLPTLASVLGLQEGPGRPLAQAIQEHVRTRRLLIVLDNCEHVADACGVLASLLVGAGPGVGILATSRQPLGVVREAAVPVPPLALPDRDEPMSSALVSDAVRLFVERAVAARPGFQLSEESAPFVVEICRRLDGLPLAIELAAARVKVLTPAQIARRLDDRFRLLTGGEAEEPRHQTSGRSSTGATSSSRRRSRRSCDRFRSSRGAARWTRSKLSRPNTRAPMHWIIPHPSPVLTARRPPSWIG